MKPASRREPGHSSHAALDVASRTRKAEKIERLLREVGGIGLHGRMLEVGCGSGLISAYFGANLGGALEVDAVDVADQRVASDGFAFKTYDGSRLPFPDASFDFVVRNHVIEHVGSRDRQSAHLRELARVLMPTGVLYLAAPSKWQPVEPHFGLPFLSWIPTQMRDGYVRIAGRGSHYDCNPLGHAEFERMAERAGLIARNINAAAFRLLAEESPGQLARRLGRIPQTWLQLVYRVSPTMVYLLSRKDRTACQ